MFPQRKFLTASPACSYLRKNKANLTKFHIRKEKEKSVSYSMRYQFDFNTQQEQFKKENLQTNIIPKYNC